MPFQVMAHAYSNSLAEHPFVTKGTTSFLLCGVRDIIAQVRGYDNDVCLDLLDVDVDVSDSEQASLSQSDSSMPMSIAPVQIEDKEKDPMMDKIDIERLARFATKGFLEVASGQCGTISPNRSSTVQISCRLSHI